MRLIDADALKRLVDEEWFDCQEKSSFFDEIDRTPTIDPLKHGVWKSKMLDTFRKYEVVCSECGAKYIGDYDAYDEPYDFEYCPNCGAKMEGDEG